jgi:hypothetical protein
MSISTVQAPAMPTTAKGGARDATRDEQLAATVVTAGGAEGRYGAMASSEGPIHDATQDNVANGALGRMSACGSAMGNLRVLRLVAFSVVLKLRCGIKSGRELIIRRATRCPTNVVFELATKNASHTPTVTDMMAVVVTTAGALSTA